MADDGLSVTLDLPCDLTRLEAAGAALDDLLWQDLLVLRVVNQMEGQAAREGEADSQPDRLEAKLDLALNLLARSLGGGGVAPMRRITLNAGGFTLLAGQDFRVDEQLLLRIQLSPALPLPLLMPARVGASGADSLRAEWIELPDALRETWTQWLFRRHRRQVHARRDGTPRSGLE